MTLHFKNPNIANLFIAARLWWESKRPVDWTVDTHLSMPTVNCSGDEVHLAQAVADVFIELSKTKLQT